MRAVVVLAMVLGAGPALACLDDGDCGSGEACHGEEACAQGTCVPSFALPLFPIAGLTAYDAATIAVMDHTGPFYTGCCDDDVTAFTGERASRADGAVLCPIAGDHFPACLSDTCRCGFAHATGGTFTVNGLYASPFGPEYLYYAGHAGWDFDPGLGAPIVAPRAGMLCKAVEDPVNGRAGFATAWDKFHTFYIDHGTFAGRGMATWYLHAADLVGPLATLSPGACAAVTQGQLVATVGAAGTGLPHLHFEARRYDVPGGPEGGATRVIDPYGWRGALPDPWSNPSENAQAESQVAPLWIACGNGRIECGEICDDGGRRIGDGCGDACAIEAGFVCEGEPSRCFRDTPIGARELRLRRSASGRETLIFSTTDIGVPFPAPGGPEDPAAVGMTVQLLSATGDESSSAIPPGASAPPGWRVRTGAVDRYRWLNPGAPAGTDVRLVVFREGTLLRLVGRGFDLPLDGAQGAVAVRVSWGSRRVCAVFDAAGADVSADGPGGFHARDAARPDVADCSRTSLLGS